MSAYHIKSWCCNSLYFLVYTFSTFASNKLESSPPANSGLFNLTSSPFEIQFSGQIQSKHSLGCFLSFVQKCFADWVQMFESAFIIIKKGQFYIKFAKNPISFLSLSFVWYKLYSCEAKRLFLLLWWTIIFSNIFYKVHLGQKSNYLSIPIVAFPPLRYPNAQDDMKYISLNAIAMKQNIWWQEIEFFKCICDDIIREPHGWKSPL